MSREIAEERLSHREQLEKFEKDSKFVDKLINNYHSLVKMASLDKNLFGKVLSINSNRPIKKVSDNIFYEFVKFYEAKV